MSSIPPPPLPSGRTNHPRAVAALVCGVISLVIFPLLGVVAIVLGYQARNAIRVEPLKYKGDGLALAGLILGAFGVVAQVVVLTL